MTEAAAQATVAPAPSGAPSVADLVEAAPFDYSDLWLILICALVSTIIVEWATRTFLGMLQREKDQAVHDAIEADKEVDRLDAIGSDVAAGLRQLRDRSRDEASKITGELDRKHGIVWAASIVPTTLFGVWIMGWDAAEWGALGHFVAIPLQRYLLPWVLKRFGIGKNGGGKPRGGGRNLWRTSTMFGGRRR